MNAELCTELAVQALAVDLTDDELKEAAKKAAASVHRMAARWQAMNTPEPVIQRILRGLTKRHHITLPNKTELQQTINRLTDAAWWRRSLRKRFRTVEYSAILAGAVHAKAGKYVSDKTMKRAIRDKRRIAELLESLVAINQTTGEMLPMTELAEQSLSNPANRRRAMMARIKGIEHHAKTKGQEALFLCPSRMHARHHTGAANERYDDTGPREAQAYLNRVWRIAMRKLMHDGVSISGLRVVEPHHDGCPHWHVLVFTAPEHSAALIETMQAYALSDSPNEPGAMERRFKVERIDPAKGSAVGYVAKYVSKSIDGEGVDLDEETDATGMDAAARIVAWARTWGIRQFQFFGVPPITPTRELYRLKGIDVPSPGLKAAHQAAKANDYGAWLQACDTFELGFKSIYIERKSSRYPDETVQRIKGLTAHAIDMQLPTDFTTRIDEWRIEPRKVETTSEAISPPWTRFNNCAPVDFIDFFEPFMESETQGFAVNQSPRENHAHRYPTRDCFVRYRTPESGKTASIQQCKLTINAKQGGKQHQGRMQ
nr:replication endonuclease [uncultured Rhodoferax sp.]